MVGYEQVLPERWDFDMGDGAWCPRFAPRGWALTWAEEDSRWSAPCFGFAISRRPFGLDLHHANFPQCVVSKAAPYPLRRTGYQSAFHRVAMQVSQLD